VEVVFNKESYTITGGTREPGDNAPTSIEPDGNYTSSLKRYPVTALYALDPGAVPASAPLIFAATSGDGFYSYRTRNGKWQWNYEE
jgi:hypothetical protein